MTLATSHVALEALCPDDTAAMAPLLDMWIRPEAPISCAEDLPLLVGPGAPSRRWIVREDGEPVSHAALFRHTYQLPQVEITVGVVGAVATSPNARGRGHAARLVRHVQAVATNAGLDALVLWDGTGRGFYERFGFVRAGREILHVCERGPFREPGVEGVVRPLRPGDAPVVVALHARQPARARRTVRMWDAWMRLPETSFYVLEQRGVLRAYGVAGKGVDLQGCLHEWGGEDTVLPDLVAGVLALRDDPELVVMSPPWKEAAARALQDRGADRSDGVLGMVWLPAPDTTCRRLGRADLLERFRPDDPRLIQALFGPLPEEDLPPPLPFYLLGLDAM